MWKEAGGEQGLLLYTVVPLMVRVHAYVLGRLLFCIVIVLIRKMQPQMMLKW